MKMAKQELSQQIVLSRLRFNSIEFENQRAEVQVDSDQDSVFQIGIVNQGAPARIYLAASPEIRDSIKFLYNDFVVGAEAVVDVVAHIRIRQHGSISVTIGYGSNVAIFDIDLIPVTGHKIEVDPSLGVPGSPEKYRLATHLPVVPASVKAIGALMFAITILTLVTDIVPPFVSAISSALLLAIVVLYFLVPHIR
ncbi:MAG: hypothetical protein U9N12_01295 [Euryarchaeota archaeon]|nr:hypothetical protein [Euryarchaeota archaeon]